MSRLLLLAVIFVVIYWLLKSYRRQVGKGQVSGDKLGGNISGQAEDMVRCVHCGVHLPKQESILAGGEYYCSEAHRRAHTDKPGQA